MNEKLTNTQRQRLIELNAHLELLDLVFENKNQRDSFFREKENELAKNNKEKLFDLVNNKFRPLACEIENGLINWLTKSEEFTQVVTPIMISREKLEKMNINKDHPLSDQVFWVEKNKCLRPMLAPNLYEIMGDLLKTLKQPIRIFESGPCFRKETQGAQHMNEFTMLNLVELAGVNEGEQMERLKELAVASMKAIGLDDYEMEITKSEVYGETLDIVLGDLEIASGAYGPHFLDSRWGIFDTWVGLGIGIERIAMAVKGYKNIKRVGRSISYLDGARLNI